MPSIRLLAAGMILGLVAAACGGSAGSDRPDRAAEERPETVATSTTTQDAQQGFSKTASDDDPERSTSGTTLPTVEPTPEPPEKMGEPPPLADPIDSSSEPSPPGEPTTTTTSVGLGAATDEEPTETQTAVAPVPAEPSGATLGSLPVQVSPEEEEDEQEPTSTTAPPEPEPEPEPTSTTAPPEPEPEPEPTATTTPPEPELEREPTVTTLPPEPEPVVAAARVSESLTRCASETGWYGATRMAVLVGTTEDGVYEPVVESGEDSCERIKAAWDEITQAEAQRIAGGQYPCEYTAAYHYWPIQNQTNGPAMLVGCWPRLLDPGELGVEQMSPDPDHEAARLWNREGFWILPPNHPAMITALYDCYRDSLQGPPPGWVSPNGGEWLTILLCHAMLNDYGNPIRSLGVTPECAAQQMRKKLEERKDRGWVGTNQYTGDFPWIDCSTSASRLIPDGLTSYSQRCEAVVDASAGPSTDLLAEAANTTRDQVISAVKAMFCEGTKQALRDNSAAFDVFLSNWSEPFGEFVAVWLPPEGSICYEAASLVAAQKAVDGGGWIRVKFC